MKKTNIFQEVVSFAIDAGSQKYVCVKARSGRLWATKLSVD